jgi:hypothetical protein
VLDTCRCSDPTLNVERRDVDNGGFVGVKHTQSIKVLHVGPSSPGGTHGGIDGSIEH